MIIKNAPICLRCNEKIEGPVSISDYKEGMLGFSHRHCYYRAHPFIAKQTFRQVLINFDDQVLVRELLNKYIDYNSQIKIMEEFNRIMEERWQKLCQP